MGPTLTQHLRRQYTILINMSGSQPGLTVSPGANSLRADFRKFENYSSESTTPGKAVPGPWRLELGEELNYK